MSTVLFGIPSPCRAIDGVLPVFPACLKKHLQSQSIITDLTIAWACCERDHNKDSMNADYAYTYTTQAGRASDVTAAQNRHTQHTQWPSKKCTYNSQRQWWVLNHVNSATFFDKQNVVISCFVVPILEIADGINTYSHYGRLKSSILTRESECTEHRYQRSTVCSTQRVCKTARCVYMRRDAEHAPNAETIDNKQLQTMSTVTES